MISKGGADVFMIQETKNVNYARFCAKILWRNTNVGSSFSNSCGFFRRINYFMEGRGGGWLFIFLGERDIWG